MARWIGIEHYQVGVDFSRIVRILTELQRHSAAVAARPGKCMPWNRPSWARLHDYASSPATLPDAVSLGY
jgi:hypothetical protein